jgi:hypothetical protein
MGGEDGESEGVEGWGGGGGGWGRASFLGPQIALAYRLAAISQGPKNSRFPGPNPLPLAQVMDAAHIKSIMYGAV